MRGEPPQNLVSLLAELKLASAAQVRAVAARVRRLAGELPDFESVWVDALAQARVLTPFQAAEINSGRGESLVCGPYVIAERLASPGYAECFAARHVDTGRTVRLYRVGRPQVPPAAAAAALVRLVGQLTPLAGPTACVPEDAGIVADGVWAACSAASGTTAAEWLAENGRFPPAVVLHIAREMLARLSGLELLDAVHGDIGAAGLVIGSSGPIMLPMPGLRGVVRPSEGYSFNDMPSEAYDYLAPERIADGSPPTPASDWYACGCLWWHLLTGRAPFAGGNSLAKLKAAHAARVIDVRQLAPDVPEVLARAIEICLARDPDARPRSSGQLAELLGAPARGGRAILSQCVAAQPWVWQTARRSRPPGRARPRRAIVGAGVAAIACVALVGLWLARRDVGATGPASVAAAHPPAEPLAPDPTQTEQPQPLDPGDLPGRPRVDRHVTPAVALEPAASDLPDDLVLPGDKKLRASELALRPGQRVRGRGGKRPLVSISATGWTIACDDVCFEGVDFVWEAPAVEAGATHEVPAMMTLKARTIALRGCSFSTAGRTPTEASAPIAIAWSGAAEAPGDGELTFSDCVFFGLAAIVDCRRDASLAVDLSNSLCVASGPIVRLHRCPRAGQTLAIALEHTTTRGDSAVLECRYARLETEPGPIAITVADSALVTNPRGGLLVFSGPQRPDVLLRAISWNGQGSLVTPDTAVALWRKGADRVEVLADEELEMAGLVRSAVEFAGAAEGPPAASRITRWQVPLRSADPPGANANSLALPGR